MVQVIIGQVAGWGELYAFCIQLSVYVLTIYVENDHFIGGWCEVCVAGHADKTGIHVLTTDVWVGQVVDGGFAIRSVFEGLIDNRVVQVPCNVRQRFTYGFS